MTTRELLKELEERIKTMSFDELKDLESELSALMSQLKHRIKTAIFAKHHK